MWSACVPWGDCPAWSAYTPPLFEVMMRQCFRLARVLSIAIIFGLAFSVASHAQWGPTTPVPQAGPWQEQQEVPQPAGVWTTSRTTGFGPGGSPPGRPASYLGPATGTAFAGVSRPSTTRSLAAAPQPLVTRPRVSASTTSPATQWTTFRYDALGRVTRTTYPDGSQTRACYADWVTVESMILCRMSGR